MINGTRITTLDDFAHRPLTKRTEKFLKLCDFYHSVKGEYPDSAYLVYDFIHEHKLPFELRHFKLVDVNRIITYYWKWTRIMGYKDAN
ncbi:MAG: hypothetical protein M1162_00795 [Candidatus Thermoplasmatota archaeon]|nr:hypothetical protein [Candidatus Thermoplasmatota archaeon]